MKKLLLTLFASCAALMVACAGDSQGGRVANPVRLAVVGGADACAPSARTATVLWERTVPCRVDAYAVTGGGVLAGQDEKNDVYSQLTRVFSSGTNYGMVVVWCSDEAVPSGDALQTQFRRLTALVREKAPRCSLVLFTPCALPLNAEKGAGPEAIAKAAVAAGVQDQVYYTGPSHDKILEWNRILSGGKSLLWLGAWPRNHGPEERERADGWFRREMAKLRARKFKFISCASIHSYYDPTDTADPFVPSAAVLKEIVDEFHQQGIPVVSIPFQGGDKEEAYFKLREIGFDGFLHGLPVRHVLGHRKAEI